MNKRCLSVRAQSRTLS